jgi:hypothetical protein
MLHAIINLNCYFNMVSTVVCVFLLVSRSIHAKCQILAWNLVLVGCPLKTLHRYKYINRTIAKKSGNKTTPIVRDQGSRHLNKQRFSIPFG